MIRPSAVGVVVVVAWVAFLAVGAVLVTRRETERRAGGVSWIAARELAVGTQLTPADLHAPPGADPDALPDIAALAGQHLRVLRAARDAVGSEHVGPLALGRPAPGTVRLAWAARPDEMPALALSAPGESLTTCTATASAGDSLPAWDCGGPELRIVALHRPVAGGDSLWVVMEAGSTEQAARILGAPRRLLLRR